MSDRYRVPGILGHTAPFPDVTPDPLQSKGGGSKGQASGPVVLNLAGDYPYDWTSLESEAAHMEKVDRADGLRKFWMPGEKDFEAGLGKVDFVVSTFAEFLGAVSSKPVGSIKQVNFVSHGSSLTIGMSGECIGDKSKSGTPGTVTFSNVLKSGDLIGTDLEEMAKAVRDRFREDGEITLYLCNAGMNHGLRKEIQDALKVKVRGFRVEIRYCPRFERTGKRVTKMERNRVTTSTDCGSGIQSSLLKLTSDV